MSIKGSKKRVESRRRVALENFQENLSGLEARAKAEKWSDEQKKEKAEFYAEQISTLKRLLNLVI